MRNMWNLNNKVVQAFFIMVGIGLNAVSQAATRSKASRCETKAVHVSYLEATYLMAKNDDGPRSPIGENTEDLFHTTPITVQNLKIEIDRRENFLSFGTVSSFSQNKGKFWARRPKKKNEFVLRAGAYVWVFGNAIDRTASNAEPGLFGGFTENDSLKPSILLMPGYDTYSDEHGAFFRRPHFCQAMTLSPENRTLYLVTTANTSQRQIALHILPLSSLISRSELTQSLISTSAQLTDSDFVEFFKNSAKSEEAHTLILDLNGLHGKIPAKIKSIHVSPAQDYLLLLTSKQILKVDLSVADRSKPIVPDVLWDWTHPDNCSFFCDNRLNIRDLQWGDRFNFEFETESHEKDLDPVQEYTVRRLAGAPLDPLFPMTRDARDDSKLFRQLLKGAPVSSGFVYRTRITIPRQLD